MLEVKQPVKSVTDKLTDADSKASANQQTGLELIVGVSCC